jgi:hypothetical protein
LDKHSSLFALGISDKEKRFYNIERKDMIDSGKPFHQVLASLTNIRLGRKSLRWTNALAYFPWMSVFEEKSFYKIETKDQFDSSKHWSMMKKLLINKHSSLFALGIRDEEKRFYKIERKDMFDSGKY